MTIIDPSTVEVSISYVEPTVNSDGSALTDLKETKITVSTTGQADTVATRPATKATGGGTVTFKMFLTAPDDVVTAFLFSAVSVDLQNKLSKPATFNLTVSRVAPGSPQSFVVA